MDTGFAKAVYTALSNSMIGVLLLLGSAFGISPDLAGPASVLMVFALLSAAAAVWALLLSEVQDMPS